MTKARDLADLGNGVATADIVDANVTQAKLAGEAVNESKLQVSNAPTNGYALTAQSGNTGGMTWAETGTADDSVSEAKLQVSNAPTNGYMLTAQSGNTGGLTWAAAPTSSTTYGAVGTYVFGRRAYDNGDLPAWVAGATSAGSGIFPAGLSGEETDTPATEPQGRPQYNTSGDVIVGDESSASVALSGTWRAMGSSNLASGKRKQPVTVLVRIS